MLSQAILSSIKADLSSAPTRAQDSNNTAEPVSQSVRIPAGESVDQRARGRKITIPIEAIVVDQNAHAKRPRLTEDPSGDTSPYEHEAEDDEIEDDFDGLLSPNSRWQASEELNALLEVVKKPLQRFERRLIVREFPRPASEPAFTPSTKLRLLTCFNAPRRP